MRVPLQGMRFLSSFHLKDFDDSTLKVLRHLCIFSDQVVKGKGKIALESKCPPRRELKPVSVATRNIPALPGWVTSPSQDQPQQYVAVSHL